jgi:hypothetical protein
LIVTSTATAFSTSIRFSTLKTGRPVAPDGHTRGVYVESFQSPAEYKRHQPRRLQRP